MGSWTYDTPCPSHFASTDITTVGNPHGNSLPTCQLQRLSYLAKDCLQKIGSQETSGAFWIDTLCVPHNDTARKKALALIRKTFHDATCTVVLDREIEQLAIDTPIHEFLWRRDLSDWAHRLWTFEEGIVSEGHVLFKCEDGLLDITDMDKEMTAELESRSTGLYKYNALHMVDSPAILGREKINFISHITRSPSVFIVMLARNLMHLSTSHWGDETLCLASALNQDTRSLAALPPGDRMERFLSEIRYFVPHILFGTGPRSDRPGLGWAPATFLTDHRFPMIGIDEVNHVGIYSSPPEYPQMKGFMVTLGGYDMIRYASRLKRVSVMVATGSRWVTHTLGDCGVPTSPRAEWFDLIKSSGENSRGNDSPLFMSKELPSSAKLILLREDLQGKAILVESLDRRAGLECVKFITNMIVHKDEEVGDLGDRTAWLIDNGGVVEAVPIPKEHRWFIV